MSKRPNMLEIKYKNKRGLSHSHNHPLKFFCQTRSLTFEPILQ